MSRYSDQIHDEYGRTVPGVSVYVYKWDAVAQVAGDLEILTDDLSAPLANPLTSDIDGLWYFNSVDGQKLLEYHYGGKVQERQLILVGALPVPQAVFGGLLANATALTIPTGMDAIGTTGADVLDHGSANYVAGTAPTARSGFTSTNSRNFVLSKEQIIVPQMFYLATDPDAQNMLEGARDYLKTFALNSGGGAYKGTPKLVIPGGEYDLHAPLDFSHTGIIEGEGGGRAPAPAYGCTLLRWTGDVAGIRTQFFNTSGTTTVDGPHDGVGSIYIRNLAMEGTGSGSGANAITARAITFLDDILIRNWGGTGVQSWTGNVIGFGAVGGNTSVSRYTGVKSEGCKVAFDTRGTDSNVIKFTNCEAYQCRLAGFIDDNGAGSNTYDTCHATFNGLTGNYFTQVSFSGKFYALRWGQEVGAATNAPSGTTADNTWWAYVGTGAPDSIRPAWVSGMSGLASGGDYVMLSNFPTLLNNCYSEGGGFSQLGVGTLAFGGTNLGLSSIGGSCFVPEFDGPALKRLHAAAVLHFDGLNDSLGGFDVRDTGGTNVVGAAYFDNAIAFLRAASANGLFIQTLSGGVATTRAMATTNGLEVPAAHAYYVDGAKIIGARGAAVTDAVAAAAAPTQAEFNALVTQFNLLLARVRAATGHGLIA